MSAMRIGQTVVEKLKTLLLKKDLEGLGTE
jgi:hypothetical protein